MSHRAVTISGFVVALAVAGAPMGAMARHRHHQHPSEQGAAASQSAPGGRVSPNPRAASMRQSEEALRKALTSDPVASAAQTPGALRDPKTRAQVSAALAVATLPRPELAAGSRHRDGGYGWVGPVFWPFATFDLFDAALWGDGADAAFWGYGGADLVTGLFGPYPDDDVTAYARYLPSATVAAPQPSMLARMCGEVKSGDIAGVPVETLRDSLSLDDGQRSALDDLARALTDGARLIAAACPETLPLSAQQRVGVMSQRLDAMIAAADAMAPPLSALFDRLSDAQKAQFVALGAPAAATPVSSAPLPAPAAPQPAVAGGAPPPTPAAQACAAAQAMPSWPKAALERAAGRGDDKSKALDALQAVMTKAAGLIAASCQPADATTPPARLAAIKTRLGAMRSALAMVENALAPVYAALDPVETVDFDAVGSEPARALAEAAAGQRYRALQSAAASRPAEAKPAETRAAETRPADAAPADGQGADAAKRVEASPPQHHGGGRRHLVRYARHVPGPVHVIGRVLGALLP